jgi:hypothetical protein
MVSTNMLEQRKIDRAVKITQELIQIRPVHYNFKVKIQAMVEAKFSKHNVSVRYN